MSALQKIDTSAKELRFLDSKMRNFLRIYQFEALVAFHVFIYSALEVAYMVYPTGAGKTWTVKAIMLSLPNLRFLFAVPLQNLADQTKDKDFGLWYGSKKKNWDDRKDGIIVINTLIKRVESGEIDLNDYDCLFIDECHQHKTEWVEGNPKNIDWLMTQATLSNCKIVGMTGTPYNADASPLKLFRKAKHLTSPEWQDIKRYIKEGFLADLIYKVTGKVEKSLLESSNSQNAITASSEEEAINLSRVNEAKVIYSNIIGQGIAVCRSIIHAEELEDQLTRYAFENSLTPLRTATLSSKVKKTEQVKILEQYRLGNIDIILSVDMLTTGVDLAMAQTLFLARVIGSHSLWRQIVGRILRLWDGKTHGLLIDMYDTIGVLGGHPLDPPKQKEITSKGERELSECTGCGNPLQRVTVDVSYDFEQGLKTTIKECVNCGEQTSDDVGIDYVECQGCLSVSHYIETKISKGWVVAECSSCKKDIQLEKLTNPQILVAYRNREDAYNLARKFLATRTGTDFLQYGEEISKYITHAERPNIALLLEYLGDWNSVKYSDMSVQKIINRLIERNQEFEVSTDPIKVSLRDSSKLGYRLSDEIIEAYLVGEQYVVVGTIPSYIELEKMKNNKKRSFESLLNSWFKKRLKVIHAELNK